MVQFYWVGHFGSPFRLHLHLCSMSGLIKYDGSVLPLFLFPRLQTRTTDDVCWEQKQTGSNSRINKGNDLHIVVYEMLCFHASTVYSLLNYISMAWSFLWVRFYPGIRLEANTVRWHLHLLTCFRGLGLAKHLWIATGHHYCMCWGNQNKCSLQNIRVLCFWGIWWHKHNLFGTFDDKRMDTEESCFPQYTPLSHQFEHHWLEMDV